MAALLSEIIFIVLLLPAPTFPHIFLTFNIVHSLYLSFLLTPVLFFLGFFCSVFKVFKKGNESFFIVAFLKSLILPVYKRSFFFVHLPVRLLSLFYDCAPVLPCRHGNLPSFLLLQFLYFLVQQRTSQIPSLSVPNPASVF